MDNSLKSILDESKSAMILLPTKPYFDQVAAGLSLYLSLKGQKNVQITSPSPMVVEFNRLVGVNEITQEMGDKNLVIEFSDYKANDIERVSYDIIDGRFRLTVIPKPGVTAPGKNQVQLNYSGVTADTVILIGGANESHFPSLSSKDLAGAKIVHIGTKSLSTSSDKGILSLARPSSSVSEIVAGLINDNGLTMNGDIATNLLMGIEEASDNYTSNYVNADTFEITAALMRAGGKRLAGKAEAEARDYPKGAIPQQVTQQVDDTVGTQQSKQGGAGDDDGGSPPQDWLKPKIYKGTSVS